MRLAANTNSRLVHTSSGGFKLAAPVPEPERRPNHVGCITCPTRRHKNVMVNVYEGEYQCQECRWGL